MLTKKQKELMVYLEAYVGEKGLAPSFEEMKAALDLQSKSGIHRLMVALEERGFIRRLPNRARAIEIVRRLADETSVVPFGPRPVAAGSGTVSVPVMGRIAAGVPIAAIQVRGRTVEVPAGMLSGGEHFALEVSGDSMIEAGINDGDTVLVRRTDTADSGDIVVALVDDEEATLKRIRKRRGAVALEAANPAYETRVYEEGRVKVQGRLACLFRVY